VPSEGSSAQDIPAVSHSRTNVNLKNYTSREEDQRAATQPAMLRRLFQKKPKHERLHEEPEVRYKGLLVSERDLGYTFVRPGGKTALKSSRSTNVRLLRDLLMVLRELFV